MPTNLTKQYVSEYTDTVTATSGDVDFGFNANSLRLKNDGSATVFLKLGGAGSGATTSGHELRSSEELFMRDQSMAGFSFKSTGAINMRIGAWGD